MSEMWLKPHPLGCCISEPKKTSKVFWARKLKVSLASKSPEQTSAFKPRYTQGLFDFMSKEKGRNYRKIADDFLAKDFVTDPDIRYKEIDIKERAKSYRAMVINVLKSYYDTCSRLDAFVLDLRKNPLKRGLCGLVNALATLRLCEKLGHIVEGE